MTKLKSYLSVWCAVNSIIQKLKHQYRAAEFSNDLILTIKWKAADGTTGINWRIVKTSQSIKKVVSEDNRSRRGVGIPALQEEHCVSTRSTCTSRGAWVVHCMVTLRQYKAYLHFWVGVEEVDADECEHLLGDAVTGARQVGQHLHHRPHAVQLHLDVMDERNLPAHTNAW